MKKQFDTRHYLQTKKCQDYAIVENDFEVIERLCKKVDVVKKVYQTYSADLSIKNSDREITPTDYEELLSLITTAAESCRDFKFLNTALKLNDILLDRGLINKAAADINIDHLVRQMVGFPMNNWSTFNERT